MTNLIELKKVTKVFYDNPKEPLTALKDISLDIQEGEFFVLVGPSGSGKSTVLRILSGLEKEFEGEMKCGSDFTKADVSFVFQQFALLPWLSVAENIGLGLVARHTPEHEISRLVAKELKILGLEKFAHSRPHDLSGGMRQRVGVARALATQPKIIFMDEPFSELDSFTAEELRKEILKIWQERRLTIVMVTHIVEDAIELADRIGVLTQRPGRVEKIVNNRLTRPREKRSEEFYRLEDQLYKLIKP